VSDRSGVLEESLVVILTAPTCSTGATRDLHDNLSSGMSVQTIKGVEDGSSW